MTMPPELHALHLAAGLRAGPRRTCGAKVRYPTEESATRASDAMNGKPTTRSVLEAYPCAFCAGWHVGRKMSRDELSSSVGQMLDEASVLRELRGLVGDEIVTFAEAYPVWVLPGGQVRLSDARFFGQFHFQLHPAPGAGGAGGACVRASATGGHPEIDELADAATATRFRDAASGLPADGLRLLIAPARGVEALWHPGTGTLAVVFSQTLAGQVLGSASFEAELARVEPGRLDPRSPSEGHLASESDRDEDDQQGSDAT